MGPGQRNASFAARLIVLAALLGLTTAPVRAGDHDGAKPPSSPATPLAPPPRPVSLIASQDFPAETKADFLKALLASDTAPEQLLNLNYGGLRTLSSELTYSTLFNTPAEGITADVWQRRWRNLIQRVNKILTGQTEPGWWEKALTTQAEKNSVHDDILITAAMHMASELVRKDAIARLPKEKRHEPPTLATLQTEIAALARAHAAIDKARKLPAPEAFPSEPSFTDWIGLFCRRPQDFNKEAAARRESLPKMLADNERFFQLSNERPNTLQQTYLALLRQLILSDGRLPDRRYEFGGNELSTEENLVAEIAPSLNAAFLNELVTPLGQNHLDALANTTTEGMRPRVGFSVDTTANAALLIAAAKTHRDARANGTASGPAVADATTPADMIALARRDRPALFRQLDAHPERKIAFLDHLDQAIVGRPDERYLSTERAQLVGLKWEVLSKGLRFALPNPASYRGFSPRSTNTLERDPSPLAPGNLIARNGLLFTDEETAFLLQYSKLSDDQRRDWLLTLPLPVLNDFHQRLREASFQFFDAKLNRVFDDVAKERDKMVAFIDKLFTEPLSVSRVWQNTLQDPAMVGFLSDEARHQRAAEVRSKLLGTAPIDEKLRTELEAELPLHSLRADTHRLISGLTQGDQTIAGRQPKRRAAYFQTPGNDFQRALVAMRTPEREDPIVSSLAYDARRAVINILSPAGLADYLDKLSGLSAAELRELDRLLKREADCTNPNVESLYCDAQQWLNRYLAVRDSGLHGLEKLDTPDGIREFVAGVPAGSVERMSDLLLVKGLEAAATARRYGGDPEQARAPFVAARTALLLKNAKLDDADRDFAYKYWSMSPEAVLAHANSLGEDAREAFLQQLNRVRGVLHGVRSPADPIDLDIQRPLAAIQVAYPHGLGGDANALALIQKSNLKPEDKEFAQAIWGLSPRGLTDFLNKVQLPAIPALLKRLEDVSRELDRTAGTKNGRRPREISGPSNAIVFAVMGQFDAAMRELDNAVWARDYSRMEKTINVLTRSGLLELGMLLAHGGKFIDPGAAQWAERVFNKHVDAFNFIAAWNNPNRDSKAAIAYKGEHGDYVVLPPTSPQREKILDAKTYLAAVQKDVEHHQELLRYYDKLSRETTASGVGIFFDEMYRDSPKWFKNMVGPQTTAEDARNQIWAQMSQSMQKLTDAGISPELRAHLNSANFRAASADSERLGMLRDNVGREFAIYGVTAVLLPLMVVGAPAIAATSTAARILVPIAFGATAGFLHNINMQRAQISDAIRQGRPVPQWDWDKVWESTAWGAATGVVAAGGMAIAPRLTMYVAGALATDQALSAGASYLRGDTDTAIVQGTSAAVSFLMIARAFERPAPGRTNGGSNAGGNGGNNGTAPVEPAPAPPPATVTVPRPIANRLAATDLIPATPPVRAPLVPARGGDGASLRPSWAGGGQPVASANPQPVAVGARPSGGTALLEEPVVTVGPRPAIRRYFEPRPQPQPQPVAQPPLRGPVQPGTGPGPMQPGTGPGPVQPGTGPGPVQPGTAPQLPVPPKPPINPGTPALFPLTAFIQWATHKIAPTGPTIPAPTGPAIVNPSGTEVVNPTGTQIENPAGAFVVQPVGAQVHNPLQDTPPRRGLVGPNNAPTPLLRPDEVADLRRRLIEQFKNVPEKDRPKAEEFEEIFRKVLHALNELLRLNPNAYTIRGILDDLSVIPFRELLRKMQISQANIDRVLAVLAPIGAREVQVTVPPGGSSGGSSTSALDVVKPELEAVTSGKMTLSQALEALKKKHGDRAGVELFETLARHVNMHFRPLDPKNLDAHQLKTREQAALIVSMYDMVQNPQFQKRVAETTPTTIDADEAKLRTELLAGTTTIEKAYQDGGDHRVWNVLRTLSLSEVRGLIDRLTAEPHNEQLKGLVREIAFSLGLTSDQLVTHLTGLRGEGGARIDTFEPELLARAGITPATAGRTIAYVENAYTNTTVPHQNLEFRDRAGRALGNPDAQTGFYLHVDNSQMKKLNDTALPNGLLSGKLTNLLKEAIWQSVQKETYTGTDGKVHHLKDDVASFVYDDYKGLRIEFKTDDPAVRRAAESAYQKGVLAFERAVRANPELMNYLVGKPVRLGIPGSWVSAGIGKTDAQAATAARLAKQKVAGPRVPPLLDYASEAVQTELENQFTATERGRERIEKILGKVPGALQGPEGMMTLSPEAAELVRKAESDSEGSPDKFAQAAITSFKNRFGVTLTHQQALVLRHYQAAADNFSMPIYDDGLPPPDLNRGEPGGTVMFVDVRGAGAGNNAELYTRLARVAANTPAGRAQVNAAVEQARHGQNEASQRFEGTRDAVPQVLKELGFPGDATFAPNGVAATGDDIYFRSKGPLTEPQRHALIEALAKRNPAAYRLATVESVDSAGHAVSVENMKTMAAAGGKVEKGLRKKLEGAAADGKIPFTDLNKMMIGVHLVRQADGSAKVEIYVAGETVTADALKKFEKYLPDILKGLNDEKDDGTGKVILTPGRVRSKTIGARTVTWPSRICRQVYEEERMAA